MRVSRGFRFDGLLHGTKTGVRSWQVDFQMHLILFPGQGKQGLDVAYPFFRRGGEPHADNAGNTTKRINRLSKYGATRN